MNSQSFIYYQPKIFPSELSWVTTGSHLSYHILIHAIFFDFSRIHWAEFLTCGEELSERPIRAPVCRSVGMSESRKVTYKFDTFVTTNFWLVIERDGLSSIAQLSLSRR